MTNTTPERVTDLKSSETWRMVWRMGFAPQLSSGALQVLRVALESDTPKLLQGATTTPAPDRPVWLKPVEAACVLGFCGWKGENLETVESVEEYFGALCFRADQVLGAPAACRYFLNWYDDTPRDEMRRELLAEVVREQTRRAERAASGLDPELFVYSPGQPV
jgi:hypothetical protein